MTTFTNARLFSCGTHVEPSRGEPHSAGWPLLYPVGDLALLIDFAGGGPAANAASRGVADFHDAGTNDAGTHAAGAHAAGARVSPGIAGGAHALVLALDAAITRAGIAGIVECIPAYASLLVTYDPAVIGIERLSARLRELLASPSPAIAERRRWRVPVAYGGAFGPDLDLVARHCGMNADAVVAAHSGATYVIAMFGFLPGFAYLSGLPAELAVPRRATPRTRVAEGGIGIGGDQTAIGSVAGPSGWHQIGRTPVRSFVPNRQPVAFLGVGDEVELYPVDAATFADMEAAAMAGEIVAERCP